MSAIATGNYWFIYDIDTTNGTQISVQMNDLDFGHSAISQFTHFAPTMNKRQQITARELSIGDDAGTVFHSRDTGGTWFSHDIAHGAITAIALGNSLFDRGAHGMVGTADGHLEVYHDGALEFTQYTDGGDLPAAVSALCPANERSGTFWAGDASGGLYLAGDHGYLVKMGQFASPIVTLSCPFDPRVVYGICNDSGVGLFMAVEQAIGAKFYSLDSSDTWHALSMCGRSLLLAGENGAKWSPDGGVTIGTIPTLPDAGPYLSCSLKDIDRNEIMIGADSTVSRSFTNGQTWDVSATGYPGLINLINDPTFPGVVYALGAAHDTRKGFFLTRDDGQSFGVIDPGDGSTSMTCLAVGCLHMETI